MKKITLCAFAAISGYAALGAASGGKISVGVGPGVSIGQVGHVFQSDPTSVVDYTRDLAKSAPSVNLSVGYDHVLPKNFVLGLDVFGSYSNFTTSQVWADSNDDGNFMVQNKFNANTALRVGYKIGGLTPFILGGVSTASLKFRSWTVDNENPDDTQRTAYVYDQTNKKQVWGYVVGCGILGEISPRHSLEFRYMFSGFKTIDQLITTMQYYDTTLLPAPAYVLDTTDVIKNQLTPKFHTFAVTYKYSFDV